VTAPLRPLTPLRLLRYFTEEGSALGRTAHAVKRVRWQHLPANPLLPEMMVQSISRTIPIYALPDLTALGDGGNGSPLCDLQDERVPYVVGQICAPSVKTTNGQLSLVAAGVTGKAREFRC
jgi:hypothetical protein